MSGREAKFCLDRNRVRWVLIEGVINRKTAEDDPAGGQNLPVAQIQAVEKTVIERRRRSPLALPATYAGLFLLAVFGWLATMSSLSWWVALPGLALGAALLFYGLRRMSGQGELLDSFQIVAPGTVPEEWRVVGSHLEVIGFVEGVKTEMQRSSQQQAALRN